MNAMTEEYLTIDDAAKEYGVSRSVIFRAIHLGQVKAERLETKWKAKHIRRSELKRYMQSREPVPTPGFLALSDVPKIYPEISLALIEKMANKGQIQVHFLRRGYALPGDTGRRIRHVRETDIQSLIESMSQKRQDKSAKEA